MIEQEVMGSIPPTGALKSTQPYMVEGSGKMRNSGQMLLYIQTGTLGNALAPFLWYCTTG